MLTLFSPHGFSHIHRKFNSVQCESLYSTLELSQRERQANSDICLTIRSARCYFNITITYHSTGSAVARLEADDINTAVQYYGKDRGGHQHCCSVLWQGPRRTSTLLFSTMARTEADINTDVQYYGKDRGGHQHCCSVLWQGPRRTSTLLFSTMARTEADINTAVQYYGKDRGGRQHCCSVLWQGPRRTSTLLFSTVARTEADDINSDNALDHFHVFTTGSTGQLTANFLCLTTPEMTKRY